jgi:hypothetical protein
MMKNFPAILHVFKIVAFWSSINVFGWRMSVFNVLCNVLGIIPFVDKVIGIVVTVSIFH